MAFGGVDDDAVVRDRDRLRRPIDAADARALELALILRFQASALSGAIRVTSAV